MLKDIEQILDRHDCHLSPEDGCDCVEVKELIAEGRFGDAEKLINKIYMPKNKKVKGARSRLLTSYVENDVLRAMASTREEPGLSLEMVAKCIGEVMDSAEVDALIDELEKVSAKLKLDEEGLPF